MKTSSSRVAFGTLLTTLALALQACASPPPGSLGRAALAESDAAQARRESTPGGGQEDARETSGETPSDDALARPASYGHLPLGWRDSGLCFGNSRRWNGLRFNFRDHGVESVRGINVTLWSPREPSLERLEGLALGIAPAAVRSSGASVGLLASLAEERLSGLQLGGLAVVSEGDLYGASAGGLAVVAEGELRGISVGGLAVVSEGGLRGASLGGLAVVAEGEQRGLNLAGLAVVAEGEQRGLNLAGLAVVAEGRQYGISLAGLACVSESEVVGLSAAGLASVAGGDFRGVGIGGLAAVCEGDFRGIGLAGLAVGDADAAFADLVPTAIPHPEQETSASGLMVAGYRVQATRLNGVAAALLVTRSHELRGLAVSAYNGVSGRQTGLSLGVFNYASELRGVQVGVLNYVGDNPGWLRWLPLLNAHF